MQPKKLIALGIAGTLLFGNIAFAVSYGYVYEAKIEMHSPAKLDLDKTLSLTTFYKLGSKQSEFTATTMDTDKVKIKLSGPTSQELTAKNDQGEYEIKMSAAKFYTGNYTVQIAVRKKKSGPFTTMAIASFELVGQTAGGVVLIPEPKKEDKKETGASKPQSKPHPAVAEKSEVITESTLSLVSEDKKTLRVKIEYRNFQKKPVSGKKPVMKIVEEIIGTERNGYNIYTVPFTTQGNEIIIDLQTAADGKPLVPNSAFYSVYAEYETGFGVKAVSNMLPFAVQAVEETEKTASEEPTAAEVAIPGEPKEEKKEEPTAAETPIYEDSEKKTESNSSNNSNNSTPKPTRTNTTKKRFVEKSRNTKTKTSTGRSSGNNTGNKEPTAAETP